MSVQPPRSPQRRIPVVARILALLALSALLHWLAIGWVGGGLQLPDWRGRDVATVQIELQAAAPPVAAAPPPPQAPKPSQPRKRPAPPKPAQPAPVAAAATPSTPAPDPAAAAAPDANAAQDAPAQPAAAQAEAAAPQAEPAAPPAPEQPRYAFRMPPPAELKYDVQAWREGKMVYGSGKIAWRSDGSSYQVQGEAGILFLTLLEFGSRGAIDENGVSPLLYTEKRFRKSETATHFRRNDALISFSASTTTYPRRGDEQDRASIVWQLAAIGLGEPGRYQPGAQFDFFVAGVRDGETWTMQVIGLESIAAASGQVQAWHLVRVPRPGSYEQKLDIWLAPQRNWYPLKLRWTETSGEFLEMSAAAITPLPPQSPPL
jgi:hypothetical protein